MKKTKKCLLVLFTLITASSIAQNFEDNDIKYEVTGINEVTIVGHNYPYYKNDNIIAYPTETLNKGQSCLVIPQTVLHEGQTYSVTAIGNEAFRGCVLSSITIPQGIISIGYSAFANCKKLEEIILPDGLLNIGKFAFVGCAALTSVVIPESVTIINESTFEYCKGLTSVKIPNSITDIEYNAFNGCTNLTFPSLSPCVFIRRNAFRGCPGCPSEAEIERMMLKQIVSFKNIKYFIYDNKARVIEFNGNSKPGKIVIPETIKSNGKSYRITEIGRGAFKFHSHQITEISLPYGITIINDEAFAGCMLKEIVIPASVTTIGNFAFAGCNNLSEIIFNNPANITFIGNDAFSRCVSLKIKNFPECFSQKISQIWAFTQKKDKISDYQSFIDKNPFLHELNAIAAARIEWQKANAAVVKLDYPQTIKRQDNGRYAWSTVFREISGNAGYILNGYNFYITDTSGKSWNQTGRQGEKSGVIEVRKSGNYEYSYWCSDTGDPKLKSYHITWVGEDDWGNSIEIKQVVNFDE